RGYPRRLPGGRARAIPGDGGKGFQRRHAGGARYRHRPHVSAGVCPGASGHHRRSQSEAREGRSPVLRARVPGTRVDGLERSVTRHQQSHAGDVRSAGPDYAASARKTAGRRHSRCPLRKHSELRPLPDAGASGSGCCKYQGFCVNPVVRRVPARGLQLPGMKTLRPFLAGALLVAASSPALAQKAVGDMHPEEAIPDNLPRMTAPGPYDDFIKEVQQKLNELGFDAGPVNGDFGLKTQAAIAQFQLANVLPASGALDDQTLLALDVRRPAVATEGNAAAGSTQPADTESD